MLCLYYDDCNKRGLNRKGTHRYCWAPLQLPPANVVSKSELDHLEYTLSGVMHFVDKWLEGKELEQDEVNRAIIMREKTLRIVENAKTDVAREILAELEEASERWDTMWKSDHFGYGGDAFGYLETDVDHTLYELKKKYTEEKK